MPGCPSFLEENFRCCSIWGTPSNYGLTIYIFGITNSCLVKPYFIIPDSHWEERKLRTKYFPFKKCNGGLLGLRINFNFIPILYFYTSLKTSENQRFSEVFRGCRNGTLAWDGLNGVYHLRLFSEQLFWLLLVATFAFFFGKALFQDHLPCNQKWLQWIKYGFDLLLGFHQSGCSVFTEGLFSRTILHRWRQRRTDRFLS